MATIDAAAPEQIATAHTGPARSMRRAAARWLPWITLAIIAGSQLGELRIDNALDAWMPQLADPIGSGSFVVLGYDRALEPRMHALGGLPVPADDPGYAGRLVPRPQGETEASFVAAIDRRVRSIVGDEAAVAMGGPAAFRVAMDDWSQRRMPLIVSVIVVVGMGVMWAVTRSIAVAASATAAITLSQVVLLGLIAASGQGIDMTLTMVPPMMMALGYSYAAHHAARPGTGGVLIACLATTVAGVLGFTLAGLPPITAFALWGVAGLVLVWLAVVMLVPAAGAGPPGEEPVLWRRAANGCVALTRNYPGPIVTIVVMVCAVVAGLSPSIRSELDPVTYFPPTSRFARDMRTLDRRLTGMLPFTVEIVGDVSGAPPIAEASCVRRVTGPWPTRDGVAYAGFADLDGLRDVAAASERWRAWGAERAVEVRWRGVAAQLEGMTSVLRRVALAAAPSMLLIAALAVAIATRRPAAGLLSAAVNAAPVAGIGLLLEATGWPVTLPSLMIGAVAIGMAVDDTLHLSVEASRGCGDMDESLRRCFRPCAGSTLAVCAGMLVFALSPFTPTAQFGVVMAVAAGAALLGDVVLLPVLWGFINRRTAQGTTT